MTWAAKAWAAVASAAALILGALAALLWWRGRRDRRQAIRAVGDAAAAGHEGRAAGIEEDCADETHRIETEDVRALVDRLRSGARDRMRARNGTKPKP